MQTNSTQGEQPPKSVNTSDPQGEPVTIIDWRNPGADPVELTRKQVHERRNGDRPLYCSYFDFISIHLKNRNFEMVDNLFTALLTEDPVEKGKLDVFKEVFNAYDKEGYSLLGVVDQLFKKDIANLQYSDRCLLGFFQQIRFCMDTKFFKGSGKADRFTAEEVSENELDKIEQRIKENFDYSDPNLPSYKTAFFYTIPYEKITISGHTDSDEFAACLFTHDFFEVSSLAKWYCEITLAELSGKFTCDLPKNQQPHVLVKRYLLNGKRNSSQQKRSADFKATLSEVVAAWEDEEEKKKLEASESIIVFKSKVVSAKADDELLELFTPDGNTTKPPKKKKKKPKGMPSEPRPTNSSEGSAEDPAESEDSSSIFDIDKIKEELMITPEGLSKAFEIMINLKNSIFYQELEETITNFLEIKKDKQFIIKAVDLFLAGYVNSAESEMFAYFLKKDLYRFSPFWSEVYEKKYVHETALKLTKVAMSMLDTVDTTLNFPSLLWAMSFIRLNLCDYRCGFSLCENAVNDCCFPEEDKKAILEFLQEVKQFKLGERLGDDSASNLAKRMMPFLYDPHSLIKGLFSNNPKPVTMEPSCANRHTI